ncbi:hypothetical protein CPB86DRAFT_413028 [Serendipita vermifera]|nr:hypothetical protein CPB86DRAFT_413028 [Serendipita vermifera]
MRIYARFSLIWVFLTFYSCLAHETVKDAARFARSLVDSNDAAGTLATVFPADHPTLAGQPFALMEYYASCHTNGSLTFIFMPISQNNRNIIHSEGHAATFTVATHPARAASARVSLMGNVTVLYDTDIEGEEIGKLEKCFLARHPDARWWIPGKKPAHTAYWARFDPRTIYYVGGFGSEHYIGYIPLRTYQEAHPQDHATNSGELRIQ